MPLTNSKIICNYGFCQIAENTSSDGSHTYDIKFHSCSYRCNDLNHALDIVDKIQGLFSADGWEESADDNSNKLKADRDRLLEACRCAHGILGAHIEHGNKIGKPMSKYFKAAHRVTGDAIVQATEE